MTELIGKSVRGRLPYLPIHRRPPLKLPNDARVAVWTIVNVENWSPTGAMPRTVLPPPMGQPLLPDVPNWAWHEYGMRVGFWRFLEALGASTSQGDFALNGSVCEVYPKPARPRATPAGSSWATASCRGRCTGSRTSAAAIADTIAAIEDFTGNAAARLGEPGPDRDRRNARPSRRGGHRVRRRLGARRAAGHAEDDGDGRMVSVPYTVEINDVVISAVQQQPSTRSFAAAATSSTGSTSRREAPRVMAISIHPYLHGRAAPDQISGDALRLHPRPRGRRDVDGRRDFGLVSHAGARVGSRRAGPKIQLT